MVNIQDKNNECFIIIKISAGNPYIYRNAFHLNEGNILRSAESNAGIDKNALVNTIQELEVVNGQGNFVIINIEW